MGGISESVQDQNTSASSFHRRILIEMMVITVFGGVAATAVHSTRFGIGILFGGALAIVNYVWLKRSSQRMVEKAIVGEPPRLLPVRYILRYAIMGLILAAIYTAGVLPVIAVVLGMASFAFAIVIEGIISIFYKLV
ncbi:MAG: ATP synthase subunit I [Pyrinomonadaceae bacterium]